MNRLRNLAVPLLLLWMSASAAVAEPLPFRKAMDLALRHSGSMAIAAADQTRARQNYLELRNLYTPQITVGSGLGFSYGYPMSIEGAAPSIVSVNTRQFVLNLAHRDFMRAARTEWDATGTMAEDRKNQVLLETALAYAELDKLTTGMRVLQQQERASTRMEQVVSERVEAGVDSGVQLTKAKLATARVRLRMADTQGAVDVLRMRLSQLTGLPAEGIETVTESMPRLPSISQTDDLTSKAVQASPVVRIADQQAQAKQFRARAQHKSLYPQIDLAGSYGLFSRFNNFDEFFLKFQRNNASFGLAIRFPIFNLAQRAHAEAADAEALRAKKEAAGVKDQVSSETLKLQRSVRQLEAAREVARLEHQLARADVDAVMARVEAGLASVRDQEAARVAEGERYAAFLDANFELERALMRLLKATGEIQKWAME